MLEGKPKTNKQKNPYIQKMNKNYIGFLFNEMLLLCMEYTSYLSNQLLMHI